MYIKKIFVYSTYLDTIYKCLQHEQGLHTPGLACTTQAPLAPQKLFSVLLSLEVTYRQWTRPGLSPSGVTRNSYTPETSAFQGPAA